MGIVTSLYSLGELALALYYDSLVIFADGLHNLSDGVSLAVAFWAGCFPSFYTHGSNYPNPPTHLPALLENKKLQTGEGLTYGWRRTELLGGLFNGLFLVSMAIFVVLQAIPKFISPETPPANSDIPIMIVAGKIHTTYLLLYPLFPVRFLRILSLYPLLPNTLTSPLSDT